MYRLFATVNSLRTFSSKFVGLQKSVDHVLDEQDVPNCNVIEDGSIKFLTKGDNNSVDDRGLYAPGQLWLERKDVVGRARGFVPYVGMVTILMNDYPKFKYAILAALGLFVLIHRE